MTTLSALIVAHNEEARLEACLTHVAFADEVVVLLDRCTDNSKAIAEAHGAKIIAGAWPLEGDRRNAGLAACTEAWILEVDADEWVSPALADEITALLPQAEADYYLVPVDNYIGQRLVRHGWGGSIGRRRHAALFRAGHKHWQNARVHPPVTLKGVKGHLLAHPIRHYVDENLPDMLLRLNRYAVARGQDLAEKPDNSSLPANIRRFFSRFYLCYVRRKGYKEGRFGFAVALCAGLFPLLAYLYAHEYRQQQR